MHINLDFNKSFLDTVIKTNYFHVYLLRNQDLLNKIAFYVFNNHVTRVKIGFINFLGGRVRSFYNSFLLSVVSVTYSQPWPENFTWRIPEVNNS